MPNISVGFVGRGSFYKEICAHLQDTGYNVHNLMTDRQVPLSIDTIVNYGLTGSHLRIWGEARRGHNGILYNTCPDIKNKVMPGNKYQCLDLVRQAGVPCPESKPAASTSEVRSGEWIQKPYYSFGGRGIAVLSSDNPRGWNPSSHYVQKRVTDRRYELRVHVTNWLPKEQWLVSKRTHPDGDAHLTWNFHQGGTFSNIEQNESNTGVFKRAKVFAEKAINALGLQFGAVDFIVQNGSGELPIWFLEVNMAPGFTTDRTREFYFMAFKALAAGQSAPVPATPPRTQATPPPAATREMPAAATARSMTAAKRMTIISWLASGNNSFEELIAYINTLR